MNKTNESYGLFERSLFNGKPIDAYVPNKLPLNINADWQLYDRYANLKTILLLLNTFNKEDSNRITILTIRNLLLLKEAVQSS